MTNTQTMDKIVALAKRRGFFYPGSDLYGGLANTYDYGPMGTELLRNIKNLWWDSFVTKRADMVGLDASIVSHHRIWEASGHVATFADAMVDCKNCRTRLRADHLIEDATGKNVEGLPLEELDMIIEENNIKCPNCGKHEWTKVRKFNLLFPIQLGLVEGEGGSAYLRGETAQGMFINFQNVLNSTRVKLPFGIGQIGKSFRNEITPGNSIFRTIEFEQGEIEYFFDEKKTDWEALFNSWKESMWEFVTKKLGVRAENLRWRAHTDEERSFYSKKTEDLEYQFPFGFKELWGLAYRTNYDLSQHQEFSKKDLTVTDPQTGEKTLPHVIEPAVGINRLMLTVLADAYTEEENRTVLKLSPRLSPVKAAVFPLLANKPELTDKAREVFKMVQNNISGKVQWDDRGNIGKRYLAQDEIGTPYSITIDFQTLEDNAVTVRDRDSAQQERVSITDLVSYLHQKLV
ncbi:MAG TPA: glycine--tRNA ligase [Candidatus Saccharimonadales bacterium]|nr:glycine--tRNA ligase [Candidatus Saccharimonadales bacterium]